ncbi:MAG: DUF4290 domain-containing protein [Prevotellaceae bacterium]|jgi:hypothetical protein|nr:DUF4290 domain-containing protein [Prevotellaceae bacterium]
MEYKPRTDLILPEYGRNIQQMVKHAIGIEDRAERTRCAKTIINIMGNMFPYLRDVEGFKFKLWDHLAVMSEFKLDIDYPFEMVKPEQLMHKPNKIAKPASNIRYMHYGRILQMFINQAVNLPENDERRHNLIAATANHMKKCFLVWNKEVVDDRKILMDLCELSNGKINLNHENYRLLESRQIMLNRRKFNNNGKKEPNNQPHRNNPSPNNKRR